MARCKENVFRSLMVRPALELSVENLSHFDINFGVETGNFIPFKSLTFTVQNCNQSNDCISAFIQSGYRGTCHHFST